MRYEIRVSPKAQRQYRKLSAEIQQRIGIALTKLSENPRPSGVAKLSGSKDRWRVRVGDYRIVYTIDDKGRLVVILIVAHRREVYQ